MYIIAHNASLVVGGGEIWVARFLAGLQNRGHRVLSLCRNQKVATAASAFSIPTGVRVLRGDAMFQDALAFSRMLRRERPDALLLTTFKKSWLGGLAAQMADVPLCILKVAALPNNPGGRTYRIALKRWVDLVVLNADAIVQSNLTYYTGHGYYSDPYKSLDTRPDHRRTLAWLTRYNQAFPAHDGTMQLTYRLIHDSFGDHSNMVEAAWVQGLPQGWSVTPNIRYLTQHGADFYFNPPWPRGYVPGQDYTADTRLASFGAFTVGLTVAEVFPDGWSAYGKYQFYRQKPAWYLGGSGSPDILDFSARWFEFGVSKTF